MTVTTNETDLVQPEAPIRTRESRSVASTSAHSASSSTEGVLDSGSVAMTATATVTKPKM
jgi:hypothetical protein